MNEKLKGALRSKMIWFSLLLTILGTVQLLLPQVQALLEPKDFALFTIFVGVVVAVLRWMTTAPLEDK